MSNWRCIPSPTGAHHWVVSHDDSSQKCKYCDEYKELDIPNAKVLDIPSWEMVQVKNA